jgi:hypothetical protein
MGISHLLNTQQRQCCDEISRALTSVTLEIFDRTSLENFVGAASTRSSSFGRLPSFGNELRPGGVPCPFLVRTLRNSGTSLASPRS